MIDKETKWFQRQTFIQLIKRYLFYVEQRQTKSFNILRNASYRNGQQREKKTKKKHTCTHKRDVRNNEQIEERNWFENDIT